jgi:hypothetical protein
LLDAIAYSLLRDGIGVTVFDSLARPGSECNLARRGTSLAGVSAGNDRIEGQQNCCRPRWQSRHPTAKGNSKWNRWPDVREHSARVDATCLKKLSQRSAKVRHGACISNIAGGFAAEVI